MIPDQHRSLGTTAGFAVMALSGVCLILAACGFQQRTPDAARVSSGAFGSNGDPDTAAINLASWAFAVSSRTHGQPVEAARSVAAVDYLAGALYGPRWSGVDPLVAPEMLQARQQVRAAIGIAPNASSQVVVDSLFSYAATMQASGNEAEAGKYLTNPSFTLTPQATEAKLLDLPFLSETNIATMRASSSMNGDGASDQN